MVITIINLILEELLHQLTDMEKLYSHTEQNISFSIKFSILTFISSAVVPGLVYLYTKDMIESRSLLLSNALTINVVNAFVPPTLWIIDPPGIINSLTFKIKKKLNIYMTQGEANKLLQGSDMDLGGKYCFFSTTLATSLYFAPILPSGLIICLVGGFYQYWLEKYCFLVKCVYRRPEMFSHKISQLYVDYYVALFICFPLGHIMLTSYKPYLSAFVMLILIVFSVHKRFYVNMLGIKEEEINNLTYDDVKEQFNLNYFNCNPVKEVNFDFIKTKLAHSGTFCIENFNKINDLKLENNNKTAEDMVLNNNLTIINDGDNHIVDSLQKNSITHGNLRKGLAMSLLKSMSNSNRKDSHLNNNQTSIINSVRQSYINNNVNDISNNLGGYDYVKTKTKKNFFKSLIPKQIKNLFKKKKEIIAKSGLRKLVIDSIEKVEKNNS